MNYALGGKIMIIPLRVGLIKKRYSMNINNIKWVNIFLNCVNGQKGI